jgi:hypothetical protein
LFATKTVPLLAGVVRQEYEFRRQESVDFDRRLSLADLS